MFWVLVEEKKKKGFMPNFQLVTMLYLLTRHQLLHSWNKQAGKKNQEHKVCRDKSRIKIHKHVPKLFSKSNCSFSLGILKVNLIE